MTDIERFTRRIERDATIDKATTFSATYTFNAALLAQNAYFRAIENGLDAVLVGTTLTVYDNSED